MINSTPSYSSFINLPRHEQEFFTELVELPAQEKSLASRMSVAVKEHSSPKCIKTNCCPTSMQAFSVNYTFQRLYFDWPDDPPEKDKYVMIRVIFSDAFTDAERNILVPAFQKFTNVILTQRYNDRMNNASGFTFPRRNELEVPWGGTFPNDWSEALKQWRLFAELTGYLPPHRPDYKRGRPRYQPIYVERFDENNDTWGRAELNHYAITFAFKIFLNAHIINNVSTDADEWAGVIAHEMMHNFGWNHDTDTTNRNEFIYFVQNAVRDL